MTQHFCSSDKMVAYYLPSTANWFASWITYGLHGNLKWYIQLKYCLICFVRNTNNLTQINLTPRISQTYLNYAEFGYFFFEFYCDSFIYYLPSNLFCQLSVMGAITHRLQENKVFDINTLRSIIYVVLGILYYINTVASTLFLMWFL